MKPTRREFFLACLVFTRGFFILRLATEPRLDYRDKVSCYSNLKRIGLALAAYTQDNDQILLVLGLGIMQDYRTVQRTTNGWTQFSLRVPNKKSV